MPLIQQAAGRIANSIGGANELNFAAGAAGHLVASVAGSLYSQEGVDYFTLGKLDAGNAVSVSSRTISVSGLTYKVQVVGKTVGLLPDADGSQLDAKASVTVTQNDDYYVKVEAISGVGIRGQYLINLDVQDTVAPKVTSIVGLPVAGGTVGLFLNPVTVNFSEDLQTAGVNALSTWEMRSAGVNGTFGDADDVVYTVSASGSSRTVDLRVTDGPLQPGADCSRVVPFVLGW